ncbi:MAG TPA: AMP-binding protein [Acidimicrobiales bacterium]|nr:AMP-binding protein [Acidimicrobiales bacterium]
MHNVAGLHEAIAGVVGDRDCIVTGTHRWTWPEVTDRTRRLAAVLQDAGLGLRADPRSVEPWESPHDHVALYLYNGPEYLEGMLGAWKARCAPINVNYRYVATELAYVLRDSDARAVIVGGHFAATLAEVLPDLPGVELVLQVDDGSGAPLLAGARWYEDALTAATPRVPEGLSPDDRYVLYTGGTTGMPKGVLWRQGDFLATCLGVSDDAGELLAKAARRAGLRGLPSAPLMHGAAHWNALSAWAAGGTVVLPRDPSRADPADILSTCEREQVSTLQIVGDAFARPLLDEVHRAAAAGTPYDLSALRFLLSGGAILSATIKAALVEAVPRLRIIDVLGSSETGRQAVADGAGAVAFTPSADATVLSPDRSRVLPPDDHEIGWLAQRGRVPLGYLGDPDKTAATFPVVDGARYSVPGDRVRWSDDGRIELLGRESVTINTGGEKVFAEEVEQAITSHPAVVDAIVVGRPHPRWGQEVVAVVAARNGDAPPSDAELGAHCRQTVAGYKVPKAFVWVDEVRRSPSGKPDYAWARDLVT